MSLDEHYETRAMRGTTRGAEATWEAAKRASRPRRTPLVVALAAFVLFLAALGLAGFLRSRPEGTRVGSTSTTSVSPTTEPEGRGTPLLGPSGIVTDSCGNVVYATSDQLLEVARELNPPPTVDPSTEADLTQRYNDLVQNYLNAHGLDDLSGLSSDQQNELNQQISQLTSTLPNPTTDSSAYTPTPSAQLTPQVFAELAARQSARDGCP